jgi:organic radical activating enzyme
MFIAVKEYLIEKAAKERLQKRKTLGLSIHLVDHCNLNCRGCDNFSCIADEKYHAVTSLEKDFERIHELAEGRFDTISLLGGEPLLHPELLSILDIAAKYFRGNDLKLVTNGILLLKQTSNFWKICHKNNIKVTITKYPINLSFEKIEQVAKEYNVALEYYGDTGRALKKMHKIPLNLSGNEDQQKSFNLCYKSNNCIMLDEGKIYTCVTIPYIKYFNKQFGVNLSICDNDYIDIYKINTLDEIFDFLCKPMPFCRYCNTKEPVYNIDWSVSKKDISEWV